MDKANGMEQYMDVMEHHTEAHNRGHHKGSSMMDARPVDQSNSCTAGTGHSIQNQRAKSPFSSGFSSNNQSCTVGYQPSDDWRVGVVSHPSDSLSSGVISQPSDLDVMEYTAGVDTNISHAHSINNAMETRIGPHAERDPGFFGPRQMSNGQYDNVPMEQGNEIVYQDFGPTPARYVEPQIIRNAGGYQGIKAAQASSTVPAPVSKVKMEYKNFMSHSYDMTHKKRGKAIIINNIIYREQEEHRPRSGSYRDTQKIIEMFQDLALDPVIVRGKSPAFVHTDLSTTELRSLLRDASDPTLNDYADYDCFIMVVLSYGIEGAILCADKLKDEFIEIKEILENFKPDSCPSLIMKPKIFMFQLDPAITLEIADSCDENDSQPPNCRKIPKEADIVTLSSYISSSYGWIENDETGLAWFTRALTEGLREFLIKPLQSMKPVMDFLSVLTRINMLYARIMASEGLTPDRQLGALQITSSFTKRLVFTSKPTDYVR